jgi:hypothetical protein
MIDFSLEVMITTLVDSYDVREIDLHVRWISLNLEPRANIKT